MGKYSRFEDFKLSKKLQEAVGEAKFEKPTDLQKQVIPIALEGKDAIFEARSGMGKSACFAIPFFQHWLRDRSRKAMVITSSASSVKQLGKVMSRLCPLLKARVLRFTVRDDYFYPEFLEKTPIVILEFDVVERFMRRERDYVANARSLGLDEFDLLLEREEQLARVISQLPGERQTLVCANELTEQVLERGRWYCDPNRLEKIKLVRPEARWPEDQVQLQYVVVDERTRFDRLADLIRAWSDAVVLVVTGSDRISKYVVDRLKSAKLPGELLAYANQLDAKQSIVNRVATTGKGVMVACEAAMNGLTISKIDHLVSWDLPNQLDNYWRRIDRFAFQGPVIATVLLDRRRVGAVPALERRLGRQMVQLDQTDAPGTSKQKQSSSDANQGSSGILIPERFRMSVFAKPEELQKLAPHGVVKTLGNKFVPARKRR